MLDRIDPRRVDGAHALGRAPTEHFNSRRAADPVVLKVVQARAADDSALEFSQRVQAALQLRLARGFVPRAVVGFEFRGNEELEGADIVAEITLGEIEILGMSALRDQ